MAVNKVVFSTVNGDRTLIDLTRDTATADTVFDGTVFHGADGEQKTGTFTISEELTEQDALLSELAATLAGKASGGSEPPALQEKSVIPSKSAQVVQPDDGYDGLSKVNVGAIPAEYIVPSGTLSITENGTHAVGEYANVSVNVPVPDGYVQPSGTLNITENGEYNVTDKAAVVVAVESSGGGGGGGVETVTCTIVEDGPSEVYQGVFYYVNSDGQADGGVLSLSIGSTVRIQKNTLFYASGSVSPMSSIMPNLYVADADFTIRANM